MSSYDRQRARLVGYLAQAGLSTPRANANLDALLAAHRPEVAEKPVDPVGGADDDRMAAIAAIRALYEKVAEELEELHGWISQPDGSGEWFRRNASWYITDTDGGSTLTVTADGTTDGYSLRFGPNVPYFLIVAACAEAAADCWRCGTRCEGDCNEPDVTVSGEKV